jgi:hypothetical protein
MFVFLKLQLREKTLENGRLERKFLEELIETNLQLQEVNLPLQKILHSKNQRKLKVI